MDVDGAAKEAARRRGEILIRLRNDLRNHQLAIITGAGVTLSVTADETGKPLSRITWTGLIRNGLDYLASEGYMDRSNRRTRKAYDALEDPDVDGLLDAANIMSSQMKQHGQFPTWLESVFGSLIQEVRHPALMDVLKALHEKGATLLTTNYDDILEQYCGLQRIGRSNQDNISRFQRGDLKGVFHIHGSYHDAHEVVLDTTDYYEVKHSDEVQNILKTFLQYKTILFIGCGSGLEDPNFDALLRWASERHRNLPYRHCLLIRDDDSMNYQPLLRVKYGPRYEDLVLYLKRLLDDHTEAQKTPCSGYTDFKPTDPTVIQLLKSLYFKEMHDRQNDIKPAADGTCTWLLEHQTFREWLDQEQGLLWIRGNPGTGKSTLLKYAVRKMNEIEPQSSLGKVLLVSFFFHGRGTELQRTALGLFRSILYQVIYHIREQNADLLLDLKKFFRKKCEPTEGLGIDWSWHLSELKNNVESLLLKLLQSGKYSIRIVIDALDESQEKAAIEIVRGFQSLLKTLFAAQVRHDNKLGICFSCRHYPALALDNRPEIRVQMENKTDITTYVRYELEGIRSQLQRAIIERADGSFQWASLVVDKVIQLELRGEGRRAISTIQQTPQGLNELYQLLLEGIDPDNRPRSLKLIQWILFATRPLTLDELRFAMALDADTQYTSLRQCRDAEEYTDDNEAMQRKVKHLSRGLAEVRLHDSKQTVQFIHQSVIDFLVLQDGLRIIDSSRVSIDFAVGHAHHRLSRSCIRYIAMEEVGRFESLHRENLEIEFPFMRYAITSWVIHAEQAEAKNIFQSDILDDLRWPSNSLLQRWSHLYRTLDPSSKDRPPESQNLLHVVSRFNLISTLRAILEDSTNFNTQVNSKDNSGWTPLSLAVCKWNEAVVKLLIKKDAVDRNTKDPSFGRTPLLWAVENRNEDVVKLLLASIDVSVNLADNYGWTPLLLAARNGDSGITKLLAEKNANDQGRVENQTHDQTLLVASERGFDDLVGLLVERDGIELNPRGSDSLSPLFLAVRNRHTEVVKLLVEKEGVELNFQEPRYGQTPLSWAAENGYEETVKLLIKKDVIDLNTKDSRYGRTPLLWAARNGHNSVVKLLVGKDGTELNAKDSEFGYSPLSWAAERGHTTIVQLLIGREGVNLNAVDSWDGQTPLSLAANRGHAKVVAILLETNGVDPDAKDPKDQTPLFWAARNGHAEVVRLLLQKDGVNTNCKDSEFGRTPLWWAENNGHREVEWLLINSRGQG